MQNFSYRILGWVLYACALTGVNSLSPQAAHSSETIYWLWFEQAPYFIGNDPSVGQGIGDQLTRYYQKNLPEYEHQNIRVNPIRYDAMIEKEMICVPVAWLTENEREHLIHTRPHTLEPPAGIYIHASKRTLFGKPGTTLSLRDLLKNPNLTLGVLRGMEYSPEVDQLLLQYEGEKNLLLIDAPMTEINLNLLRLNRLDYLIGLPGQKRTLQNNGESDEYIFYGISEIHNYIPMYSHCSNSKTGRAIVEKLEHLLTKDRLFSSIALYERWYDDIGTFRATFIDYIINENPNPSVSDM